MVRESLYPFSCYLLSRVSLSLSTTLVPKVRPYLYFSCDNTFWDFLYDSQTFHAKTRQRLSPFEGLTHYSRETRSPLLGLIISLSFSTTLERSAHIFQIKWPAGEKLSSLLNFKLPASGSDQEFLLDFQLQKIDRCTTLATFGNSYIHHHHHKLSSSYLSPEIIIISLHDVIELTRKPRYGENNLPNISLPCRC